MTELVVDLARAAAEPIFGGKAVQLGAAVRGGMPVPAGIALAVELVDAVAGGRRDAIAEVHRAFEQLGGRIAVRSSAVGEDSAEASFAGQHVTVLGVASADRAVEAVVRVRASARTEGALAYRARLGIGAQPRVAAVLQRMLTPRVAGVLFTKNPLDGSDERVIEATWGLGEAVVAGLVTPDRYRMRRGGAIVERTPGDKDVEIHAADGGETVEVPVAEHLRARLCLDDAALGALEALAARTEAVFGGTSHDIEWALSNDGVFLLQRRDLTR